MNCEKCGCDSKVIDSRTTLNRYLRRRRECLNCGTRFTTYEAYEKDIKIKDCKKCGKPAYKKFRLCYDHLREYMNKKNKQYRKSSRLQIKLKG